MKTQEGSSQRLGQFSTVSLTKYGPSVLCAAKHGTEEDASLNIRGGSSFVTVPHLIPSSLGYPDLHTTGVWPCQQCTYGPTTLSTVSPAVSLPVRCASHRAFFLKCRQLFQVVSIVVLCQAPSGVLAGAATQHASAWMKATS